MKASSMQIQQIAKTFWNASLIDISFPITTTILEQAILLTQPVSVVKLNKLSLLEVSKYLNTKGSHINCPVDDSELYGFILTYNAHTYIFLNGTESSQEQCFTLAHELAHYLLDYKNPRQLIIGKYGASIVDALNCKREFTSDERLLALLHGISLKPFTYLLDAPASSAFDRLNVWKAENKADELAMELLAPYNNILHDIYKDKIGKKFTSLKQYLPSVLTTKYGLTVQLAKTYGLALANKISGGLSLTEKWNL